VGVIRALEERGLRPAIVCGSSSGAVVGGLYAAGRLDAFEAWGRALDWRQIVGYFDLSLRGGLLHARKLLDFAAAEQGRSDVRSLALPFAAVATELETGREVWLREGPLVEVLRASMALPGLVAPVWWEGRWLVDGGLVNAVPVSLCRALGADTVIGVDLNTGRLGRAAAGANAEGPTRREAHGVRAALLERLAALRERLASEPRAPGEPVPPSIYEVVAGSLHIMQVRLVRSRMADDPPDLLVTPRLQDFALLDFDRAAEAIAEGRRALEGALAGEVPGEGEP
jgi:NTE family protein